MDEKDFSLESLNAASSSKDNSAPMDDSIDFSFASADRKNEKTVFEQTDDIIASDEEYTDNDRVTSKADEAQPYAPDDTDDSVQADENEVYYDDAQSFDDGYDDSLTDDQDQYGEEYTEENTDDQAYGDQEYDEVSDEIPADGETDIPGTEEEFPEDDEADIVLSPSSTNGVTDFREHRVAKSSSQKKGKKKKKKRKSRVNNSIFGALILVTIILTVSLVVAITGIKIGMEYLGVGKSEDDITFNIPENATPDDICDILISNNIIENKTLFKIAMKLQHSPTLFPGDITLHPSMGYSTIIEELSKQRDIRKTVTITFQEGITLLEAANMLEEKKVCTAQDFLFEFNKKQGFAFENQINDSADTFYKMEGFFFPDTYEFYVNDTGYNVSRTVKSNFASKYTESIQKSMSSTDMSLYEVITLASIVQWEANSADDMPKVASVFLNRLADPDTFPKLQSDATANYLKKVVNVVGDTASKERYADIYDTYVCSGLPEGPVCNPGLDAIKAVLNPEKTKYYYFCNNLKTGKSYFAETLEQHQKNLVKAGLA